MLQFHALLPLLMLHSMTVGCRCWVLKGEILLQTNSNVPKCFLQGGNESKVCATNTHFLLNG